MLRCCSLGLGSLVSSYDGVFGATFIGLGNQDGDWHFDIPGCKVINSGSGQSRYPGLLTYPGRGMAFQNLEFQGYWR